MYLHESYINLTRLEAFTHNQAKDKKIMAWKVPLSVLVINDKNRHEN